MAEWLQAGAAELGREIGAGRADPVELAEAFLAAAAAHPDCARIYARLTPDRARAEAEGARARAKAGTRRGPLDGVPLSWKDNVDSVGIATEAGSTLLKGRVPAADAEVLAAATLGGAVCLGKTHLTELAFSGLGVNPITATPPNAFDPALAPGGSSSGGALSVAFRLAPGAVGSDTGGSVRLPAAWNGLVGLKTTHGRLSLKGVVPLAESFDTVGPLARNVEDAALIFALLGGTKPPDLSGAVLPGTRFLVLDTAVFDDIRPEPAAAFEAALTRLSKAGALIARAKVPETAEVLGISGVLVAGEAYATWKPHIEANPDAMFPPVRERFRSGGAFSAIEYVAAWQRLRALREGYANATAGYDAVLLPTSAILPPDAARLLADPAYFARENLLGLRNTRLANLLGLAAITLPLETPSTGLTLMGTPFSDERLLRLGSAAERALAG
jgi:aspartyl-tRNA(Asn)/glutamyl-tRNA(Gln) amidotransferase subunit A